MGFATGGVTSGSAGSASAASSGGSALGVVGAALPVVGDIVGAIMSWYGMNAQVKENQRVETKNDRQFNQQLAIGQKQFATTHGLNLRSQKFNEKESVLNRAERKDNTLYNRSRDVQSTFMNLINRNETTRSNFANLVGSRRA